MNLRNSTVLRLKSTSSVAKLAGFASGECLVYDMFCDSSRKKDSLSISAANKKLHVRILCWKFQSRMSHVVHMADLLMYFLARRPTNNSC